MSDELISVFTARVDRDGESLTIDVPETEVTPFVASGEPESTKSSRKPSPPPRFP